MVHVVLCSMYMFRKLSNKISGYIHNCMHSNLLTLGNKFHPGSCASFLRMKHAMAGILVHRHATIPKGIMGDFEVTVLQRKSG